MDFKIKIDLSSQSIINETSERKKKKKSSKVDRCVNSNKKIENKEIKRDVNKDIAVNNDSKKKNRQNGKKIKNKIKEVEIENPRLNLNSIISLTLPNNDNFKNDQAQKLSMITKKKPRHWEKRWVLIPNVFEFTKEIWLKKWVLVDGGEDITDNNVILIFLLMFSIFLELFAAILFKLY